MKKLRSLGLSITFMALGACAGSAPLPPSEQPPAAFALDVHDSFGNDVFLVGYQRIRDVYLHPVDFQQLSIDGLDGLRTLDEDVYFETQGDLLFASGSVGDIGTYAMPARQRAGDWAELVSTIIGDAKKHSIGLATATDEEVFEAVFGAMLADLDEFSRYVGPRSAANERANRDGYGGIGIVLDLDTEGTPHVREVFGGGPAEDAGIPADSQILTVDGATVAGLSLEELGSLMRGPANSLVLIGLRHPDGAERNYRLRRRRVVPNAVAGRLDDGFAMLQISRFNAATTEHLSQTLERLRLEQGDALQGVILDLRGNPGGLLGQSVSVADLFIGSGDIIATRGRNPASIEVYRAKSDDVTHGLPLAVLIDGRSASASEVVAAALQDAGRGVLIGAASYGKGSVQTVTRLPNNGELFLTWSELYTPSGITLHRQGVLPTVCTSSDTEDTDTLLHDRHHGFEESLTVVWEWRLRAARDDQTLAKLRSLCPWRAHEADLDVQVAKELLADAALYSQALSGAGRDFMAMRPPPVGSGLDEPPVADPLIGG